MGGLHQFYRLLHMLTAPEIVHDHAGQDDDSDQPQYPKGTESIAQVMAPAAGAGDAADKPGQQGDDGDDQEAEESAPGQEVLPETFQNISFNMKDTVATE